MTGCGPVVTGCGLVLMGCGPVVTGCGPVLTGCGPVMTGCGQVMTGCGPVAARYTSVVNWVRLRLASGLRAGRRAVSSSGLHNRGARGDECVGWVCTMVCPSSRCGAGSVTEQCGLS